MVIVKILRIDAGSGKEEYIDENIVLPLPQPQIVGVDFEDLKKVIKKSKEMGWL